MAGTVSVSKCKIGRAIEKRSESRPPWTHLHGGLIRRQQHLLVVHEERRASMIIDHSSHDQAALDGGLVVSPIRPVWQLMQREHLDSSIQANIAQKQRPIAAERARRLGDPDAAHLHDP